MHYSANSMGSIFYPKAFSDASLMLKCEPKDFIASGYDPGIASLNASIQFSNSTASPSAGTHSGASLMSLSNGLFTAAANSHLQRSQPPPLLGPPLSHNMQVPGSGILNNSNLLKNTLLNSSANDKGHIDLQTQCTPSKDCETIAALDLWQEFCRINNLDGRKPQRRRRQACQKIESGGKCKICSDTATGFHYDVLSCEGCKGFFRRSVTSNTLNRCAARAASGIKCDINIFYRRKCQECRFISCLEAGMRPASLSTTQPGKGAKKQRISSFHASSLLKHPLGSPSASASSSAVTSPSHHGLPSPLHLHLGVSSGGNCNASHLQHSSSTNSIHQHQLYAHQGAASLLDNNHNKRSLTAADYPLQSVLSSLSASCSSSASSVAASPLTACCSSSASASLSATPHPHPHLSRLPSGESNCSCSNSNSSLSPAQQHNTPHHVITQHIPPPPPLHPSASASSLYNPDPSPRGSSTTSGSTSFSPSPAPTPPSTASSTGGVSALLEATDLDSSCSSFAYGPADAPVTFPGDCPDFFKFTSTCKHKEHYGAELRCAQLSGIAADYFHSLVNALEMYGPNLMQRDIYIPTQWPSPEQSLHMEPGAVHYLRKKHLTEITVLCINALIECFKKFEMFYGRFDEQVLFHLMCKSFLEMLMIYMAQHYNPEKKTLSLLSGIELDKNSLQKGGLANFCEPMLKFADSCHSLDLQKEEYYLLGALILFQPHKISEDLDLHEKSVDRVKCAAMRDLYLDLLIEYERLHRPPEVARQLVPRLLLLLSDLSDLRHVHEKFFDDFDVNAPVKTDLAPPLLQSIWKSENASPKSLTPNSDKQGLSPVSVVDEDEDEEAVIVEVKCENVEL